MDTKRESPPPEGGRKAYLRPELRIYGNLSQITSAVGRTGAADGGSGHTSKSQP